MRNAIGTAFAPVETFLSRASWLVALTTTVALFVIFSLFADNFLTNLALSNIITLGAVLGIIAIGVAILMIAGEFDLSVGSAFAVASFVYAVLLVDAQLSVWVATPIALGAGLLMGLFNGTVVVGSGNPSFIITLGMLFGFRGLARAIGGSTVVSYDTTESTPFLFDIFNSGIGFLNGMSDPAAGVIAGNWRTSIIWFLALAIVFAILVHRARFGNWVFSTGGNRDAATAQGVPTRRVKLMAFALVGLLVSFAAIINFSERLSVDALAGVRWELFAVTAAVIGGLRLRGGFGTVAGAVLGIIMISILRQGLLLAGFSTDFFLATLGVALISIAVLNQYLGKANT